MNNVCLTGRTVRDGELNYAAGTGTAICKFTLAVARAIKKEGQPDADFISCVAFGKRAELISALTKGTLIGVTGSMQTGSYVNKEGQKVYTTDVLINGLDFLEKKSNSENQDNTQIEGMTQVSIDGGDIPF